MRERLEDLRLHWQHVWWMVRHMSGVSRDRLGKYYWRTIHEYSPSHFKISLTRWPGLSFFSDLSGWIALGRQKDDPASWMIFDVQVHDRQLGLGTLLVRAGIALARQKGARELQGFVTAEDAQDHPFLPVWYARLGFTVAPNRTFRMRLWRER